MGFWQPRGCHDGCGCQNRCCRLLDALMRMHMPRLLLQLVLFSCMQRIFVPM